jgi:uncharacterized protein YecA (UPF0149 family)
MARDPIESRYGKRQDQHMLEELARRARSKEDVEAEQELIKKTDKVKPLQSDRPPGRNDPCPCGSGKKYKKCCGKNA